MKTMTVWMTTLAVVVMAGTGHASERLNLEAFKKNPSVMPANGRLVAGNPRNNEFYILGRMSMNDEAMVVKQPTTVKRKVIRSASKRAKINLAAKR